jgi:hypothetical protein
MPCCVFVASEFLENHTVITQVQATRIQGTAKGSASRVAQSQTIAPHVLGLFMGSLLLSALLLAAACGSGTSDQPAMPGADASGSGGTPVPQADSSSNSIVDEAEETPDASRLDATSVLGDTAVPDGDTNASQDQVSPEASPPMVHCGRTKPPLGAPNPFGTPQLVAGVNTAADEISATLTADELTIYLASNSYIADLRTAPNAHNVYVSHRASRAAAFPTPTLVPELIASDTRYSNLGVSGDGNVLYLQTSKDLNGNGPVDWMLARGTLRSFRKNNTDVFVEENQSTWPLAIKQPLNWVFVEFDRQVLWYSQFRRVDLVSNQTTFVTFPNSPNNDPRWPVFASDATYFYYSEGLGGGLNGVLHLATVSGTGPLSATDTGVVTEFQSVGHYAIPLWLSPDDCRLYVTARGNSGFDIWVAERPKIP